MHVDLSLSEVCVNSSFSLYCGMCYMPSMDSTSVKSVAKHMQPQLDTCINSDVQDQVSKRVVSFDFQGQNDGCKVTAPVITYVMPHTNLN